MLSTAILVLSLVLSAVTTYSLPTPHPPHERSTPTQAGVMYPRASRYPPSNYSGRLLARNSNGTFLGFVPKQVTSSGVFSSDWTNVQSDAMVITFVGDTNANTESAGGIPWTLAPSSKFGGYKYVAAVVASSNTGTSNDLASGSANSAWLSATKSLGSKGSPATSGDNAFNDATHTSQAQETTFWTYAPNDGSAQRKPLQQLGGNWVNTDGSTVSIGFVADNGQVALTGDTGAYINQNGGTVISLYLD